MPPRHQQSGLSLRARQRFAPGRFLVSDSVLTSPTSVKGARSGAAGESGYPLRAGSSGTMAKLPMAKGLDPPLDVGATSMTP